jgi:NurA-like 5'-3' nuclease
MHSTQNTINNQITTNNVVNIGTVNNIQNINNITQNIIQNNIVVVQPILNEDLSHISIEDQKKIILLRKHAYKALIDKIYSNLKNHNVYFNDKPGKKKVIFLDKTLGICNGSSYDKLGDITMQHLLYLDNYIQIHKDNIPEHLKNDVKFLEDYLSNEVNNNDMIFQFFDKVDSFNSSAKSLLDTQCKQMVNQHKCGLINEKQNGIPKKLINP